MQQQQQPTLRLCEVDRPASGSCGFHLSRTIWDPYPWVSGVEPDSPAEVSGLQTGDCVLEVNGEDVLGKRVGEVAQRVRARDDKVTLLLWNAGSPPNSFTSAVSGRGPTPLCLQRLSSCLQSIIQLLECPVCLETVPTPAFQCCNGHVLCGACRSRSDRCPVCRVTLARGRCLLADKIQSLLKSTLSRVQEAKAISANQNTTTSVPPKLYLKSRIVAAEESANPEEEETSTPVEESTSSNQKPLVTHVEERASKLRASSAEDISSSSQSSDLCSIRSRSLSAGQIPISSSPLLAQVKQVDKFLFHCPYSLKKERFCPSVLDGNDSLIQHIRECHSGPLVQYYVKSSGVKLRLPLSSSRPIRCSSLLSFVTQDGTVFFGKVAQTPGYRLVWLWLVGDVAQAERYRIRLTLPEGDIHNGPVFPLTSSWGDVVGSNCCLSIEEGRYVTSNPEVRIEILQINPS